MSRRGWRILSWKNLPRPHRKRAPQNHGGIQARSKRGAMGESWWSRRFIDLLEERYSGGPRLARGRTYARAGRVLELDVQPGLVTAKVQGSQPQPYRVRIQVPTLTKQDWTRATKAMAQQAIFLAGLLSGEMPREIEEAFEACDLSLFPGSVTELDAKCNCSDWVVPCKHIAATYYILAERFDQDPFLIFLWRGRGRDELLDGLRNLRRKAAGRRKAVPKPEDPGPEKDLVTASPTANPARLHPAEHPAPRLPENPDDYWRSGLARLAVRPQAAAVPDAVLRELGPLAVQVRGRPLTELLLPAYERMTLGAEKMALEAPTRPASRSLP